VSMSVPARSQATVLSLPQNVNDGWTATWKGRDLPAVRVDGWQQGWRLPAGNGGTVSLRFAPARTFTVLLVVGAGLVALLALGLLVALVRARRRPGGRDPAPVGTGRPGAFDALLAVAAGGLLCGWWGLAGVLAAVVVGLVVPRFAGWSLLAGLLVLVGSLALSWSVLTQRSWAVTWSQGWTLAAVCCAVGPLAALRRTGPPAEGYDPLSEAPRADSARRGAHSTVALTGRAPESSRATKRRFLARRMRRSTR